MYGVYLRVSGLERSERCIILLNILLYKVQNNLFNPVPDRCKNYA